MTAVAERIDGKEETRAVVREVLHEEFGHVLEDISFRIQQTYDLLSRVPGEPEDKIGKGQVYAEDLNLLTHIPTGYTMSPNTPVAGSIAWSDLHIVFAGTDYTITNSNTANRYAYWDSSISTTILQTSMTKPPLDPGDVLVFVNNGGIPTLAIGASIPAAVQDDAVDAGSIMANAVGTTALAGNAVTGANLADGAVLRAGQLAANVVGAGKVADGAINRSGILGANTVVSAAVADGALGRAAQLAVNVVTAGKIADGALNRAGILAANVVSSAAIADGAVTRVNQLGTNVVTTTQLAGSAVTSVNISDSAVSTSKLATGAVQPTKMNTFQHLFY